MSTSESFLQGEVWLTNTLSQFNSIYAGNLMAIFYWHIGSWQKGRASRQSNYIWGIEEFSSKEAVVHTAYGNLPHWCQHDPAAFWRTADRHERINGSAGRELVVSLPREFGLREWIALVDNLIRRDTGAKPYQYAIHVPMADGGDGLQPHAHILYSDRIPDNYDRPPEQFFSRFNSAAPEIGGCKKESGGQTAKQLRLELFRRKELWANLQNQALAAAGHEARVSHRPQK